ncbi:PREDICTED: uncharacterized protein LOC109166764 [Ipomoea nil]|uniref:uncharacterized protein LOC109166764 n=1 Tax=Ipomoea nil TaxID=35883 RepID=UPI000901BFD2|nr:PREDICTED: uncharacterized protein LOC109166764 [Ipomoea nil]
MHGVVPTMVTLHSRSVTLDVNYPLCHHVPETLQHLLWMVMDGNITTLLQVLARCWCIWRRRNEVEWNAKPWNSLSVKMEAVHLSSEWQVLTIPNNAVQTNHSPETLQPSVPQGVLRIFVGTTIFNDSDHGYFGVVILDCNGGFIGAKNGSLRCLKDAHIAEAMAVKEALSWAKDRRFTRIMVCSDCQMVCRAINQPQVDLSYAAST